MKKTRLNIKINDIDKSQITERTFKTKEGEEVTEKILALDLVELKEEKVVHTAKDFIVKKIGFICHPSKKKEDGTYEETKFVGDQVVFERIENDFTEAKKAREAAQLGQAQDEDSNNIPF